MRVIPTRIHGILDYASVMMLFALPRLLGWSDRITTILTVMAVMTLLYSLFTRYELGAFRVLPMAWHLGLDFGSSAFLIVLALMLGDEAASVRAILAAFGAFEVVAAFMSDSTSTADTRQRAF